MKLFPCYKDKRPATKNGFKDATDDPRMLAEWEQAGYEYWGSPTGEAFWVLDVDRKSGGLDSLSALEREHGELFTKRVITQNGGYHFYFKPHPDIKNQVGVWPGIDVRGYGGYVIVPPSPGYEDDLLFPNSEAPKWLLERIIKPAYLPIGESKGSSIDGVGEGGRNNYLTRVAGRLQRSGLSYEALLAALVEENQAKCSPPLPEREVLTIVDSISRYAPADPVVAAERSQTDDPPFVEAKHLVEGMFTYLLDKDKVKGEPTGIAELDALFGGGKRLGELTVTHAEAKTGKNSLWHQMMVEWLNKGIPIGYASRELSPDTEVLPSLFTIALQQNVRLAEITESLSAQMRSLAGGWPLYFSKGYGVFDIDELRPWVEALSARGVQYFWIDHLHYLLHDPEDHKGASKFIKELKTLAKEKNVHFDLIVQPNKMLDGQQLSINSIKGGAAIGQALDNLLTLTREKDKETGRQLDVIKVSLDVARSPLARPGHIYLMYDRELQTFWVADVSETPITPEPEAPLRRPFPIL